MLMTVATLTDEILDDIPGKEQAPIVRAVNKVVRRIYTEFVSPVRGTFTTRVATSSGTATTTLDSTLVTLSGTPLTSTDPVMLIQITGEDTWYIGTYVSTSSLNLSSKWPVAGASGLSYRIVYPTVSFPKAVGEILSIEREGYGALGFNIGGSCPYSIGTPTTWSPYVHDESSAAPSDDLVRIYLDAAPDTRIVYSFWYKPRADFLSPAGADTQAIPLSDLWREAIVEGTLYHLWKQERRNQADILMQKALYEGALSRARGAQLPAATIPARRHRRGGIWLNEQRPIEHA